MQTSLIDPNDKAGSSRWKSISACCSDTGKFVVIDFSVAGIWLALEERDQFSAFLGQNNGSIATLISHLKDLAKSYK